MQWLDSAGNYESSLYNGKKFTTIDIPGAISSYAHDIDSNGDVAYSWTDSTAYFMGHYAYSAARDNKFDDPKATDGTYADGINDHKLIVGVYHINGGSTAEGFKATY